MASVSTRRSAVRGHGHEDIPVTEWTVLAQDPSFRDTDGSVLTTRVEVPTERLQRGPKGHRVHVIDYDASSNALYRSRDAKLTADPYQRKLMTERILKDPYFHQQNVYALTYGTLYQFEQALGRTVNWGFPNSQQLKVAPHAFEEDNAYYSRDTESVNFGYFTGIDGSRVFTCLSHDIVVHETTHALVDGLRPYYLMPSSTDQAGFHEGFADIVALLSVFRHTNTVEYALRKLTSRATRVLASQFTIEKLGSTALGKLAEEMGQKSSDSRGRALRESLRILPDKRHYTSARFEEEHDRGELLVAIFMRVFLKIWIARLQDFLPKRGGSVTRRVVAEEGGTAARQLLHIAIRALDYMPPVDMTYRDYLSALLTADWELFPGEGKFNYRDLLRKEFAAYGILPASNAQGNGCWDPPPVSDFSLTGIRFERLQRDPETALRFVWENRDALGIFPKAFTRVTSVRPVMRTSRDGAILRETVAEYIQTLKVFSPELESLGIKKPGAMKRPRLITLHGGGSLIFGEYGQLKFHIGSGVASALQSDRLQSLWDRGYFAVDAPSASARIARMHRQREQRERMPPQEDW